MRWIQRSSSICLTFTFEELTALGDLIFTSKSFFKNLGPVEITILIFIEIRECLLINFPWLQLLPVFKYYLLLQKKSLCCECSTKFFKEISKQITYWHLITGVNHTCLHLKIVLKRRQNSDTKMTGLSHLGLIPFKSFTINTCCATIDSKVMATWHQAMVLIQFIHA